MNYEGPGIYRHHRGWECEVLGLSADLVTGERVDVICRPATGSYTSTRVIDGQEVATKFWSISFAAFNDSVGVGRVIGPLDPEALPRGGRIALKPGSIVTEDAPCFMKVINNEETPAP